MLFVLAVGVIGVLHTLVPDHWAPIAVFARQHRWSSARTARAAALAGTGHALSTLAIGALAWLIGLVAAERLGHIVDKLSGGALVAFGLWVAIGAWLELRAERHGGARHDDRSADLPASKRMALLFILGSSPSVEALPVFFAAAHLGWPLLIAMGLVFSVTTIGTYVATCVVSHVGMEQARFPALEEYGEVLSGALVAAIGLFFLLRP